MEAQPATAAEGGEGVLRGNRRLHRAGGGDELLRLQPDARAGVVGDHPGVFDAAAHAADYADDQSARRDGRAREWVEDQCARVDYDGVYFRGDGVSGGYVVFLIAICRSAAR